MSKPKILIIDTNSKSNNYLAFVFQKLGYQTIKSNNGKEGLIAAYHNYPQIIIIDPIFKDIPLEDLIKKLRRDMRTADSKIIALSSLTNPHEIQYAIDQNFDKFLTKGPNVLEALINIIAELLEEINKKPITRKRKITGTLYSEHNLPYKKKNCKTIVLSSAKGGTGTSTICANLASMFAKLKPELKIAVIDLVLPIGSIAPIVGYTDELNIVKASQFSSGELVPGIFSKELPLIRDWGFYLLAGSTNPAEGNSLEFPQIPIIIESLKNDFDYLFIDIGKSLSRISLPVLLNSNQTIMILSLDQATVSVTNNVLKFLRSKGQTRNMVYPLINRAVGLEGLSKQEVDKIIGYEITGNIPYIRGDFSLANNSNLPIHLKFPDNIVSIALREISQNLIERMNKNESG